MKKSLLIALILSPALSFAQDSTSESTDHSQAPDSIVSATHDSLPEPALQAIERLPEFPGGSEALLRYVMKHVTYPEEAEKYAVEGKVYAKFTVAKDGSVGDVQIMRGIGYGCDKEVIRVIESMPKWSPGMQRGKAVATSFTLPVRFVMPEPVGTEAPKTKGKRK